MVALALLVRRVSKDTLVSKVVPVGPGSPAVGFQEHLDFVENPENLVSLGFQGHQVCLDRRVSDEEEKRL